MLLFAARCSLFGRCSSVAFFLFLFLFLFLFFRFFSLDVTVACLCRRSALSVCVEPLLPPFRLCVGLPNFSCFSVAWLVESQFSVILVGRFSPPPHETRLPKRIHRTAHRTASSRLVSSRFAWLVSFFSSCSIPLCPFCRRRSNTTQHQNQNQDQNHFHIHQLVPCAFHLCFCPVSRLNDHLYLFISIRL